MTKTKINGTWVTTSSGEQMWTGTKAQLAAGLADGTIPEGTKVMVTNDYDGGIETDWIEVPLKTLTGLTFEKARAAPTNIISAKRKGNILFLHLALIARYDATGSIANWTTIADMPEGLISDDEHIDISSEANTVNILGWVNTTTTESYRASLAVRDKDILIEGHSSKTALSAYWEDIIAIPITK